MLPALAIVFASVVIVSEVIEVAALPNAIVTLPAAAACAVKAAVFAFSAPVLASVTSFCNFLASVRSLKPVIDEQHLT
jgi:hypothetical protein